MVDCFDCGKELGWKDNKHSKKEIMGLEKEVGFHDELTDKMNDKEIDSVLAYIKSHWKDEIYERQISISK